jgi:hypothetical protein
VEKQAFGAHRGRWTIHLGVYVAETLVTLGRPEAALIHIENALRQAHPTRSTKYVAKCHALRGQIALEAHEWSRAESDLHEAVSLARAIQYPTLAWQAAHLLALTQAEQEKIEEATATAQIASEIIQGVASAAPDDAMRRMFVGWPRVQRATEDVERIQRG